MYVCMPIHVYACTYIYIPTLCIIYSPTWLPGGHAGCDIVYHTFRYTHKCTYIYMYLFVST